MTDQEVRAAIKGIIDAATTGATVWSYNVLSHDLNEWPGLFPLTDGKRHGWIIKRSKIETEWKHGGRERPVWIYDIWGFYGFRTGKEDDNSDNEFAVIIDAISAGFRAEPRLGIDDEVERHELLQVLINSTIDCGEETLHIAQCKLRVRLCC
jgi:hypothetical protein